MARLRTWVLACTAVLGLALGASADCNSPKTIAELRDCWKQSWNRQNLEAVVQLYANDGSLITGDGRFHGPSDIKAYLKPKIDSALQFEFSSIEHAEPSDLGYDSGTFQQRITPKTGGEAQQQDGSYLLVARKDKGRWLIVQHAFIAKKAGTPPAPCAVCMVKLGSPPAPALGKTSPPS